MLHHAMDINFTILNATYMHLLVKMLNLISSNFFPPDTYIHVVAGSVKKNGNVNDIGAVLKL